jgi:hypothetical protein
LPAHQLWSLIQAIRHHLSHAIVFCLIEPRRCGPTSLSKPSGNSHSSERAFLQALSTLQAFEGCTAWKFLPVLQALMWQQLREPVSGAGSAIFVAASISRHFHRQKDFPISIKVRGAHAIYVIKYSTIAPIRRRRALKSSPQD